jgi:hypothetical protein
MEVTDLFEDVKSLPQVVQDVLEAFEEMDNTYIACEELVDALEAVGYTCEYGLDAIPYNLTKNY